VQKKLLLVISKKHYDSIRYELQLEKYKLICLSNENFNEIKDQGLDVEYAYSDEFFDEGVQNAAEVENFSLFYKQSSIYYKLATRFILNYEINIIKAANELSTTLREKYPSEKIYIPINKNTIDIYSVFLECESIILYLINLNKNISLLSTVDESIPSSSNSIRIVNGYPFPLFKDDEFKICNESTLRCFVNSAINKHKDIYYNPLHYY
jgi:hypothetical protein